MPPCGIPHIQFLIVLSGINNFDGMSSVPAGMPLAKREKNNSTARSSLFTFNFFSLFTFQCLLLYPRISLSDAVDQLHRRLPVELLMEQSIVGIPSSYSKSTKLGVSFKGE